MHPLNSIFLLGKFDMLFEEREFNKAIVAVVDAVAEVSEKQPRTSKMKKGGYMTRFFFSLLGE